VHFAPFDLECPEKQKQPLGLQASTPLQFGVFNFEQTSSNEMPGSKSAKMINH
jgi:hypothetical protein